VITSAPALAYFDNTKEIVLNVDASIKGLGAVIMQDGKPGAFGSKTLTTCERRYANIERELLAIVCGAQKFHTYVYGCRVIVETDHKPLESIFRKILNDAPPRHPHDIPGLPWQVVGSDLFDYAGQIYLLVTDFYSKYFEVESLHQNMARFVINNLKKRLKGLESLMKL